MIYVAEQWVKFLQSLFSKYKPEKKYMRGK